MRRRMTPNLGDKGKDMERKGGNHARGVTAPETKCNGKLETGPSPNQARPDRFAAVSLKSRHPDLVGK